MTEETKIVSKVLVHECDEQALELLKKMCTQNNLVGLKVSTGDNTIGLKDASNEIDDVLKSNVDLGAVFLSEEPDQNDVSGMDLCESIRRRRPELPIFLRRNNTDTTEDLSPAVQESIAGCYKTGDEEKLNQLINDFICSMYYPIELAQGIEQISKEAFENLISDTHIRCDQPYLVKDQIIYGELFSLIPLESSWCRGYMMLQTTESEVMDLIRSVRTHIKSDRPDTRDSNNILNEVTNMIWGGIKSRYFSSEDSPTDAHRTQVPIIVNHSQKHISFGSTEPQLCFKYTLHEPQRPYPDVIIYQRLIFNLSWDPDKFAESDKAVEDLVDSGELEFF
ncbi:MAG: chemotaxis protein CheX [Oleiphilus sp.]|nr:MAG: chemotaxis protein CheX [Oleiphilus sp.]